MGPQWQLDSWLSKKVCAHLPLGIRKDSRKSENQNGRVCFILYHASGRVEKHKMSSYGLGMDPGSRNFGLAWRNLNTKVTHLVLIDSIKEELKITKWIAVESPPAFTNFMVKCLFCHMEECFKFLYPNIPYFYVSPRRVRIYFGISGKSYTERKTLSYQALTKEQQVVVKKVFTYATKEGASPVFHVDPVEAYLIARYVDENRLVMPKEGKKSFTFKKRVCKIDEVGATRRSWYVIS